MPTYVFAAFAAVFCFSVQAQLPEFPIRNIDTVTAKKIDGQYQTTTTHIPVHDLSKDGRIGILRSKSSRFYVLKPERIKGHIKNPANNKMGAGLLKSNDTYASFSQDYFRNNGFSKALKNYTNSRNFLCEKFQSQGYNPKVCANGTRDCYDITVISRFNHKDRINVRMASVDVRIEVSNPKTSSAKIEKFEIKNNTMKLGPAIKVSKMAEPNFVGDNRLLLTRVHKTDLKLHDGTVVKRANIAYSVYPAKKSNGQPTIQCDVSQWTTGRFKPVAYAPFDSINQMPKRYKFARFPFRDSLGNPIPRDGVLGGSYPWMDKDAGNLFFEAFGRGNDWYSWVNGVVRSPFKEPSWSSYDYPANKEQIKTFESTGARTMGISMLGFWTRGKTVLFDGQLNNVDYNLALSDRKVNGKRVKVHRKVRLYDGGNPNGQYYETIGAGRELGDKVIASEYHQFLTRNSSFLGSPENRFFYLEKAKPATARDVVWHFGSTRHTDEIAFDDYMNPYILINADMTGAIAYQPNREIMKHYDGLDKSIASTNNNLDRFPASPSGHPVLIQNSATATDQFMKLPKYGRTIGNVRLEPIAKGGIHGKGLWMDGSAGIQFKVPSQTGAAFSVASQKEWYVGAFLDSRRSTGGKIHYQRFIELSSGYKITLNRVNNHTSNSNVSFDAVELRGKKNQLMARAWIPSALWKNHKSWTHVGIQFLPNSKPQLYVDGMLVSLFWPQGSYKESQLFSFFRLASGSEITLGSEAANTRAFKGWTDDFKVIARNPTSEEKCNYARGTIVRVPSSLPFYHKRALAVKSSVHKELALQSNSPNGSKFTCYVRYGMSAMKNLTSKDLMAHRKNIVNGAVSVRDMLTHEKKFLKFGKKRPDYSKNNFCLSCHTPKLAFTKRQLDIRALQLDPQGRNAEDDPRRQPMQPMKMIRGIIPANYFGAGNPATMQKGQFKVDKFVLGDSGLNQNFGLGSTSLLTSTSTSSQLKLAPQKKSTRAPASVAKKSTTKKPAAKKVTAKKPTAKKAVAKKSTVKKPAAKKAKSKKTAAKKPKAKKKNINKPVTKKIKPKKVKIKKAAVKKSASKNKTSKRKSKKRKRG